MKLLTYIALVFTLATVVCAEDYNEGFVCNNNTETAPWRHHVLALVDGLRKDDTPKKWGGLPVCSPVEWPDKPWCDAGIEQFSNGGFAEFSVCYGVDDMWNDRQYKWSCDYDGDCVEGEWGCNGASPDLVIYALEQLEKECSFDDDGKGTRIGGRYAFSTGGSINLFAWP